MKKQFVYRVFKKPKTLKSGKKVYRWYYYWTDDDGKQHQKSCRGCRTRTEAEDYIRAIIPQSDRQNPLIKSIAQDMYVPDSAHFIRRQQLGKSTLLQTMVECRHYINEIVALWGELPLASLTVEMVMRHLFSIDKSGRWKNRFIEVLSELYAEAAWCGYKVQNPEFQRFAPNSRKADIFTTDELNRLFKPENFPDYQFYLFFLLCLSGGMRLGEVRAVRVKQLIIERGVLIIDGFCKKSGERTTYNKTGSQDEPKFRLVYLPDITIQKMRDWIVGQGLESNDFCFTVDCKPIRQEYAERVFYRALQAAGFIPKQTPYIVDDQGNRKQNMTKARPIDGRKLVPHSLRYTYVSRMRRELTAAELQPMTGHSTEGMVDYYNRKALDLALDALPPAARTAADTLFT